MTPDSTSVNSALAARPACSVRSRDNLPRRRAWRVVADEQHVTLDRCRRLGGVRQRHPDSQHALSRLCRHGGDGEKREGDRCETQET